MTQRNNVVDITSPRTKARKPPSFDKVREAVDNIRRSCRSFEVLRQISQAVICDLTGRGTFYHDGQHGYVFLHETRELISLHSSLHALLSKYGIVPSEQLY